jgi:hypothetical protein
MAFITIPSTWIQIGTAIKKQLFDRIKDNFDNHETRLAGVEAGISKVELFNFEVAGYITNYTIAELTGIGTFKANSNLTITEAKIILINGPFSPISSGLNGAIEIDLQRSVDNGLTWNSIFLVRPIIEDGVNTTGSMSQTPTFIVGSESITQGDLVRLSITAKKDIQGSFLVQVYGEVI